MRRPSIFVSSTCYELKQLRADLYLYVEQAGLEPVMSEHPSFPVDPDETPFTIPDQTPLLQEIERLNALVTAGQLTGIDRRGVGGRGFTSARHTVVH